jgi:hypothetical protein
VVINALGSPDEVHSRVLAAVRNHV